MDSAGAALIITVLAGIAVILAAVIIAARREQRRNEDQIARVRGVIGRVSPIDMSVNGDQQVPARRGGSTVDGWTTDDAPDQSLMRGVAERTAARFEIQQTHYANALRQSTTYFYFSLGVGLCRLRPARCWRRHRHGGPARGRHRHRHRRCTS